MSTKGNGAGSLVKTLIANGVDTCFANPGTSEMHFVAALDEVPGIRSVLCLFEGVVTGAADGYWRMARKPATTLLHLGPGLANGLANLHNAQKAKSGILNVVGNHSRDHLRFESPLRGDVAAIAHAVSHWVRTSPSSGDISADASAAVQATRNGSIGEIATLILPADTAWGPGADVSLAPTSPKPSISSSAVSQTARLLTEFGPRAMLLIGTGGTLDVASQKAAAAISAATGCQLRAEFHNARMPGGRGCPYIDRLPYYTDGAIASLAGIELLVLAGAIEPIAFFGYPNKPSQLKPSGAAVITLAEPHQDVSGTLLALADELGVSPSTTFQDAQLAQAPSGELTVKTLAVAVAATLPEGTIVVDESITSGGYIPDAVRGSASHDWLAGMGGAIGFGMPTAIGASVGAPGRPVLVLEGDGSAMYTVQSLWTMAREQLPIVVLILANHAYRSLQFERNNVGLGMEVKGHNSANLLELERPMLDWVALARGQGVPSERVETAAALTKALRSGFDSKGPYVIEAVLAR